MLFRSPTSLDETSGNGETHVTESSPFFSFVGKANEVFHRMSISSSTDDQMRNPKFHQNDILPVRMYLYLSMFCRKIFDNDEFNYFIILIIITAGILTGVETYPGMDSEVNPTVYRIDVFILAVFILEIAIKVVMEGLAPWRYFVGKDWKWNCFDFCIVFLSFPQWGMFFRGGSIKLLRLIRLARLGKLIEKIPPLQMIMKGLIGGLTSISYILLLLFLVFYLYGVMGYYLFGGGDKFHFGTLPAAMFTLFRVTLFDAWADIFFVNALGCMDYPDLYVLPAAWTPQNVQLWCRGTSSGENATFNQVAAAVYFISFIIIAGFVMLSLFIGAVTLSMNQSMEELKRSREERRRQAAFEANKAKMEAMATNSDRPDRHHFAPILNQAELGMRQEKRRQEDEYAHDDDSKDDLDWNRGEWWYPHVLVHRAVQYLRECYDEFREEMEDEEMEERKEVMGKALQLAMGWLDRKGDGSLPAPSTGLNLSIGISAKSYFSMITKSLEISAHAATGLDESKFSRMGLMYMRIAIFCKSVVDSSWFTNLITFTIIAASVLVAAQENPKVTNSFEFGLYHIESAILTIFTVEVVLKVVSEKFKPWRYFCSSWNCFDFIVVVGCYVPGAGSTVTILRLLRLLRVLKLVKRLPQLAVIVDALMNSMTSIGYIGVILLLFFYVFAILGMLLFAEADPWHFGSLGMALLSLFREITLDNWSHFIYITMYGCDVFPDVYASNPQLCRHPQAMGWISGLYHIIFTIIGAQVLLSLFIGVISTGMEESRYKKKRERRIDKAMAKKAAKMSLSPERVEAFRTVFALLDLDNGGSIEEEELKIGLSAISLSLPDDVMTEYLSKVDEDHNDFGALDEVGLVEFMVQLPQYVAPLRDIKSMTLDAVASESWFERTFGGWAPGSKRRKREREDAVRLDAAVAIQQAWRYRQANQRVGT